jgi:hypothetical protein
MQASNEISTIISWSKVEEKFFKRYDAVYNTAVVKAHLDSCGKVIGK